MQTYLKICLCLSLADILLDAHTLSSACAILELVNNASTDNTVQVKEDGYVNITFVLNTKDCLNIKDCFKVKVSINSKEGLFIFCSIVFNGMCNTTDRSKECHCLNQRQNSATVYKRVNQTDKGFLLEWTDCTMGITGKSVFSITRFIRNKGAIGTKEIIGICFGGIIILVVAAVIIKLRNCGAQGTYDIASHRDRQEVHSYEVMRGRGHGLQGHAQASGPSGRSVADANQPRDSLSTREYWPPQTEPPDSENDYLEPVLRSFKIVAGQQVWQVPS